MVITYDNNMSENMWLHGPVNVQGTLFVDQSKILEATYLQDNEKYGVEIGSDITFYTTQHGNMASYHVPFVQIGLYEPTTASYKLKPIFWFGATDVNTPHMLMSAPLFPKADNIYSLGKDDAKWSGVYSHKFVVNDQSDVMLSNGTTITQSNLLSNYYTKSEADALHTSVIKLKGVVTLQSPLPTSGMAVGDAYIVEETGTYASHICEKGDVCIYLGENKWTVIQSNWTAESKVSGLKWDESVTIANIGGASISVALPENPVDNLEIGGRNLAIYSTATQYNAKKDGNYGFTQTATDSREAFHLTIDNFGGVPAGATKDTICFSVVTQSGIYKYTYTLKNDTSSIRVGHSGTSLDNYSGFPLSETLKAGTTITVSVVITNATKGSFAWKNVMIVKGNKATDWTPAPEDIDAAINSKLSLSGGQMTGPISFPSSEGGDQVMLKDGDTDIDLLTYTLDGMQAGMSLYPRSSSVNLGQSSNYWNNGYVNTLYSYQINADDSLSITAGINLYLIAENESLIINANDVISDTAIYAPAFYETSDIRKKDIKSDIPLNKCYELIDKCQTIIYSLKDQTQEQVGMIAQEIEEFFPEVVATDKDGFKSLAYDRLVVICFKVLKDVIKRLEKLENAE